MAKMQLDAAEAHPRAREILSALDPTVPIAVRTAGPGEWITAEHMCSIMQAAYDVGGEELARDVAKSVATRTKRFRMSATGSSAFVMPWTAAGPGMTRTASAS